MNNTAQLPDIPSGLIRLALADLEACERDPQYRIDMEAWHWGAGAGAPCLVCFAGAVIAKTLHQDPHETIQPCYFYPSAARKLRALDNFRCGFVEAGLEEMGVPLPNKSLDLFTVMPYREDADQFKRNLHSIADALEGLGL
jgi:hypothetical protein